MIATLCLTFHSFKTVRNLSLTTEPVYVNTCLSVFCFATCRLVRCSGKTNMQKDFTPEDLLKTVSVSDDSDVVADCVPDEKTLLLFIQKKEQICHQG